MHVGAKNFPPAHGGTERVVYNIINSIKDAEFYLLLEWGQTETEHIKKIPEGISFGSKIKFIRRFCKEKNIDIVHFHNEKYIPIAILLSTTFKRIVLTIHGVHFNSPKYNWFQRFGFLIVDTVGAVLLKRMIFCSEYDQKTFAKYLFFRKVYSVNNGADICEQGQVEKDIEFEDTYIYIGRITPAKNILRLIEAADNSQVKLHLYGLFDKECPAYCEQVKDRLKKSRYVEYKSEVSHDKVIPTMKKYKAFLYVTLMEGLPLAVLEAASCGLYLILSDIPHHRYLRFPQVTYVNPKGFLIPKPDSIQLGARNRQHMITYFSNRKMGMEYNEIYNSLMN